MTLKVKSVILVLVLAMMACKGTVVKIEPSAAADVKSPVKQIHPMTPDAKNLIVIPLPPAPDGE